MQRASISALVTIALAAGVVASRSDGVDAIGMGILGGAILGCIVALMSHSLVTLALHHETAKAFKFVGIGFIAKTIGAVLPWGLLTFWAPAGGFADGTAYLLAYVTAVLLVLGAGVFDHLRLSATLCMESASASGDDLKSPVSSGSSTPLESAS